MRRSTAILLAGLVVGCDRTPAPVQSDTTPTRADPEPTPGVKPLNSQAYYGGVWKTEGKAVICQSVNLNGPLYGAGVRAGDVLQFIDGRSVRETADLNYLLPICQGNPVQFTIWRDGRVMSFAVTPRDHPQ